MKDLIHVGAVASGEEFDELTGDDLRTNIAVQNFYMARNFDYTNHLLESVGDHFMGIVNQIDQIAQKDHNVALNSDLF